MKFNTFNSINEGDRHEKIAVIANDLSNWRWYSHNGKDRAGDFPVIDENKYSANIAGDGTVTIKKIQGGGEISFDSTYLSDIDNIKNNVPENEKEDAWQKADWYLAEKILRAIEKAEKEENDKKAPTKQDLQATLEDDKGDEDEEREPQQNGKKKKPMVTKEILQKILGGSRDFWDLLTDFDINDAFEQTGFDPTKLFGDTTKVNPVSATANIPSSAKKSPDNSHDKVQPVEASQSHIDSNIDINDIIHKIIEKVAPNGAKTVNRVKDSYTPKIIAIIINPDGTVETETTTSGEVPANSSSSQEKNNPVINDAIKDFIQKATKDGDYTEISLDELNREKSQKTKPVSSNFSGIENAIAGLKKAAAATQETQKPNQALINIKEMLAEMNKQVKNAKIDIPTPNYDAAVENERKELEGIGAIMDSYNTMIEGIPGIIAGIDKTTTGNEATIDGMKAQLEDLGKNIEKYIQTLTKKVEEITSKFGTQNLDKITALCEKLKELAGTFEKATAAVSGTGNKTPETTETNWGKIKAAFKNVFSNVTERGTKEWNTFTDQLNVLLTKFGEKAQQLGNKFTTLLQKFIKGEKDYDAIKGEIDKETDPEIKGLLLDILEEVKNITEQLKTKKNIDIDTDTETATDTNMDTDTTETPAQNRGKSGGKVSKTQAVVEGQKPETKKTTEDPKTTTENEVTVTENNDTAEDTENKKAIYAILEKAGLCKDGKILDDTEDKVTNKKFFDNCCNIFYLDKKPILVHYINHDLRDKKQLRERKDYVFYYSIVDGKISQGVPFTDGEKIRGDLNNISSKTNTEEIDHQKKAIEDRLNQKQTEKENQKTKNFVSIPSTLEHTERKNLQNVTVSVANGDMTKLSADAYVIPEFQGCVSEGGVGYAMYQAGAKKGMDAYESYLQENNYEIPFETCYIAESGGSNAQYLIHAVTVGTDDPEVISNAVYNSLSNASKKGIKSMVIPALGTGIIGSFSSEESAKAIMKGIQQFANEGGKMDIVMDVYYSPKQFEVFQDVINSVDSKEKKDTVQLPDDEATKKGGTPEDKDTPDAWVQSLSEKNREKFATWINTNKIDMCENNYIWEGDDIKVLYIDENMNVTIDGKKQTSPWDITIKKATDEEVKNYIDELTKDLKFKVGDFVEVENDKHEKEKYEVLSLRITPDGSIIRSCRDMNTDALMDIGFKRLKDCKKLPRTETKPLKRARNSFTGFLKNLFGKKQDKSEKNDKQNGISNKDPKSQGGSNKQSEFKVEVEKLSQEEVKAIIKEMKNDFDMISQNSHSQQKIHNIDTIKKEAEEGKEYCNKKGWKKEAEALQKLIDDIIDWQDSVELVNSFLKDNAPEYECRTVTDNDIWLQRVNSDAPGFWVSVNDFTKNVGEKLSAFLKKKDEEFFKNQKK